MNTVIYYHDLDDSATNEMLDYCVESRFILSSYTCEDISDLSYEYDTLHVIKFTNDNDALVFKLRYPCK